MPPASDAGLDGVGTSARSDAAPCGKAAEALEARGARLIAQPGIERGGCLIESDLGQVDARIATRWALAAAVLGSELPWRDGDDAERAS